MEMYKQCLRFQTKELKKDDSYFKFSPVKTMSITSANDDCLEYMKGKS